MSQHSISEEVTLQITFECLYVPANEKGNCETMKVIYTSLNLTVSVLFYLLFIDQAIWPKIWFWTCIHIYKTNHPFISYGKLNRFKNKLYSHLFLALKLKKIITFYPLLIPQRTCANCHLICVWIMPTLVKHVIYRTVNVFDSW
jgi:hypothetical protein